MPRGFVEHKTNKAIAEVKIETTLSTRKKNVIGKVLVGDWQWIHFVQAP